jgi:glucose dehydrogenase
VRIGFSSAGAESAKPAQGNALHQQSWGAIDPTDGEWTMQSKNYEGWRYSGLAQIDTATVRGLREAWTFSTGTLRGHEGAPLVVGSTMYIVTPFPNIAYALDLSADVQPSVKWKRPTIPLREWL